MMTKEKHTPGPWAVDFGEAFHIRPNDGGTLAQVTFLKGRGGLGGRRDAGEVAANARLIAAAPDLLEALEDMTERQSLYSGGHDEAAVTKARAAIAKAKGDAQ